MVDPHDEHANDTDGSDEPEPHEDDPSPRDAFDDIVRGLDMDWTPDDGTDKDWTDKDWTDKDWTDPGVIAFGTPASQTPPELRDEADDRRDLDAEPDPADEQFYRRVGGGPVRPIHRGRVAAWAGVLGTPAVLAICLLAGIWISRPVLLTAGLTVVAGSIYLISQLPERGPSHPDWPDDGAVL